jgi:hypothetical protein
VTWRCGDVAGTQGRGGASATTGRWKCYSTDLAKTRHSPPRPPSSRAPPKGNTNKRAQSRNPLFSWPREKNNSSTTRH